MKKFSLNILFLFCLTFLFENICFSSPSYYGTTGLVFTPVAESLDFKNYNLGFKRIFQKEGVTVHRDFFFLNYGMKNSLEVGASSLEEENKPSRTLLQAKLNVSKETQESPGVSAGAIYLSDDIPSNERTTLYAVASQKLNFPRSLAKRYKLSAHIGIGNKLLDGAFGGIDIEIESGTSLFAEYDTNNFNFGARLAIASGIIVEVVNIDKNWGIGVSVQVGGK